VVDVKITSTENVFQVLTSYNQWWKTGIVPGSFLKPIRRFAYYEAINVLQHPDIRRMAIISGARRIGKTTILYQMIDKLIEDKINPKRIIYISFDHPLLKLCTMNEILDIYHNNVYAEKDAYYFFDEIQYADNWDTWLKTIYDMQPASHAVATGSASPLLLDRASESGVGRWRVLAVPTLSFYEYCELVGAQERPELDNDLRPADLINLSRQEQTALFMKLSPLYKHFLRYLQVGGFPELTLSEDNIYAQKVLREDVVDKVLKRDIPSIFNIRNVADIEKIFLYLCYHSSNVISIDAIAKELNGVTRPTVEKYIQLLKGANLIYISPPIEMGGKKILKAQPKIYIADAAIRNAVLMKDNILVNPDEMGIIAETAVYKHVNAFYYRDTTRVGYFRMVSGKNKEIDIVVESLGGKILIEVKYQENSSIRSEDAIVKLCDEADRAFLVTKLETDYGPLANRPDKIFKIPAYAFMYLLGHVETTHLKYD
jgi:uncharacterized protein